MPGIIHCQWVATVQTSTPGKQMNAEKWISGRCPLRSVRDAAGCFTRHDSEDDAVEWVPVDRALEQMTYSSEASLPP